MTTLNILNRWEWPIKCDLNYLEHKHVNVQTRLKSEDSFEWSRRNKQHI